jgi:membrane protease subunit HflC
LDPPVERVLLSDQKRLLVDAFARYRITDALTFFQTVRTEVGVRERLGPVTNAALRGILGNVNLASVLSEERDAIMRQIQDQVNTQAGRFGIELVDVRIRRADLPDEISDQVYQRMRSEREREAAEFRARGFERAQRIKATADREATVIRAEAKREAEILRGQGEGRRTQILNDAYGQDQSFFSFYRSMQAYEASLASESTYMVLSPDSEFFDHFDSIDSGREGLAK